MQVKHNIFFEESPQIKLILDLRDFKIIDANKAANKFFKQLHLNGKKCYLDNLIPSGDSDYLKKQLKKLANRKSFKINSSGFSRGNGKLSRMDIDCATVKTKT